MTYYVDEYVGPDEFVTGKTLQLILGEFKNHISNNVKDIEPPKTQLIPPQKSDKKNFLRTTLHPMKTSFNSIFKTFSQDEDDMPVISKSEEAVSTPITLHVIDEQLDFISKNINYIEKWVELRKYSIVYDSSKLNETICPSQAFYDSINKKSHLLYFIFSRDTIFGMWMGFPVVHGKSCLGPSDFMVGFKSNTITSPKRFVPKKYSLTAKFSVFNRESSESGNEYFRFSHDKSTLCLNDPQTMSFHYMWNSFFVDETKKGTVDDALPKSNTFITERVVVLYFQ
ncbi:hypothetical protein EIN_052220 [Entamoeba invadens IP1]|uniref:hypothetical protein n=1 Tax=Entamoeba invadens IP1 TaxID=370355 RepID=UPI0002C3ECEA|nr:hypothetical protein EIN_052220 [Entamoeba invadens IP1]ELP93017.1 hypothetical protein EIN_052220 [Entamoeba invadens IP1]|eukprot:XP_004259788.1 hypothetical protein EIN_052220 [Entamoeba invadens IP1]